MFKHVLTYWMLIGLLTIWLSGLSFFVFRMMHRYNSLIVRTKKTSIDEILDSFVHKNLLIEKEIVKMQSEIKKLAHDSQLHYQKIGFLRFNPFDRVAGDQSFVISFLDGENSGILMNFLYTRDGVRVYAKRVVKGVSAEHDLSHEEKEVIKKAS